jgi:hypothetical protein
MIQDQTCPTRFVDLRPFPTQLSGLHHGAHLIEPSGAVMKRLVLVGLAGGMLIGQGALAQDSAATPPLPPPTQSTPPPAAHPPQSAQKADPATAPNTTGAPKTKQGKPAEKQKAYTGNTGKKTDPGTACSSARPTPNGGVDCGTTGDAATAGKVPK